MPRVTAAARAGGPRPDRPRGDRASFSEHGFHRATMQDIVRASRPVGRGDLHLLQEQGRADPRRLRPDHRPGARASSRERLARGRPATASGSRSRSASSSTRSRSSSWQPRPASVLLAQAWAEADTDRRRSARCSSAAGARSTASPSLLIQEGIARGELPGLARRRPGSRAALAALLDGVAPRRRIEEGAGYRREDAERRVLAMLELLLAAPRRRRRPSRSRPRRPARPCGSLEERGRLVTVARGPCPDRPRADRPGRSRLDAAPRAHGDRALAHPEPLGLLGAAPRRAGHPRGAGARSGRPAAARSST